MVGRNSFKFVDSGASSNSAFTLRGTVPMLMPLLTLAAQSSSPVGSEELPGNPSVWLTLAALAAGGGGGQILESSTVLTSPNVSLSSVANNVAVTISDD